MRRTWWGIAAPWLALMGVLCAGSCQKVAEPVPVLTQAQWQRIQEHILTEAPQVEHPVGAVFGGKVELIGYNLEPAVVETGTPFTITWYWRVLEKLDDRWEIFVHLDSGAQRQSLDHEAIDGLYTALYWQEGQIIEDVQTQSLEAQLNGTVSIYIGLWRRVDEARMPVSRAGSGVIQPDGRLLVGTFEARRHIQVLEAPRRTRPITIDGALREVDWREAPQTDVFVQPNDGSEVADARTQARALWDEDALYIGLTANDRDIWSTIRERDGDLWNEEVLEVYLDPLGDGRNYVEIQINPLGTVFDAMFPQPTNRDLATARTWNVEGMQAAVDLSPSNALEDRTNTDRRWTAEFRIPWASLPDFGTTAHEGDTIRANFYRYDRPDPNTTLTVAWAPVYGGSFHQPDRFGEIRLVAARVPAAEGTGEGTGEESGRREGTGAVRLLDTRTLRLPPQIVPERLRPEGSRIHRGP